MKKEKQIPQELKQAFTSMICTTSIYKKLGCSKSYPSVIRFDMRRGIWTKAETMRELLIKAGWQKKTEETWVKSEAKRIQH